MVTGLFEVEFMRKSLAVAALLLGCATPALAQSEPQEFGCSRQLRDAAGKLTMAPDPALRIIEMTRSGDFTPPPPPAGQTVVSYFCLRSELTPAVNDWKILALPEPVPFMIAADVDGNREMLMLEMENGRLRVRVRSSVLTPDQRARIAAFLNTSQERFYKK